MKKLVLFSAFAAAAFLAACNSIPGTLTVAQDFQIVNPASPEMIEFCKHHPDDYYCRDVDVNNPTMDFHAGSYRAELEFPSSSEVTLTIRQSNNNSNTLRFKIPQNMPLPTDNGSFAYSSAQVNQPFDLSGSVATQVSESPESSGRESCVYYRWEQRCNYVPGPNGHPVYQCHDEYVPYYGWQDVQYHIETVTKNVDAALARPGTSTVLANFSGSATTNTKIYDYQGPCF